MQAFERLKVWHKARDLAVDVHRVAGTFPGRHGTTLVGQLRRASLSVPSNIAEGAGKPGDAEFRRYLHIAMGSAAETANHLRVAYDLDLINSRTYDELTARVSEIRRMLTGLIKRLKTEASPPS